MAETVGGSARGAGVYRPFAAAFTALALALIAAAHERIRIEPKFRPGDTIYYRIEMHTVSTGQTTTPIINPEGGTKFSENVDLLVRLDVLRHVGTAAQGTNPGRGTGAGAVRMRVTYVRAHADSESDAPAFDASSAAQEYDRLAGQSYEFTLEPGGTIRDVREVDDGLPNGSDVRRPLSWLKRLEPGNQFPKRGIAIGQKWSTDKHLRNTPLEGLVWRAQSTYVRNEACRSPATRTMASPARNAAADPCAVILTQFQISRRGSKHADETPPDYLRHGLRTSGTVTGSGEGLESISLATGLLENSTQSSTQRVDFAIINAANGETIHRVGHVQTQTIITRVVGPAAPAPAQP